MQDLADSKCTPCEEGGNRLGVAEVSDLVSKLQSGWEVVRGHHLKRDYKFSDFRQALRFTNEVGELAEKEGHHPDIYLSWGKVCLEIWTHASDGLTQNDFVLAAKIDKLRPG